MGEAKQKQSATAKLIERFPACAFCGGIRATTTREHMPPKSLFDNSFRPDRLVMPACAECNRGTSTADLVAALVSRWDMYASNQSQIDHSKLSAQIKLQAPEVVREWLSMDSPEQQRRARRHLENHGVNVPFGARFATVGPTTIRHLNVFAHKVALGLYFEHFRRPLSNTGRVQAIWKSKEDFSIKGVPQSLLNLFDGYNTLIQGRWNASEAFEYRFARNTQEGLFGCFARLRQGLFILGFAIERDSTLEANPELGGVWIKPDELLEDHPHFLKKNG
ncbi:hypothetical protein SE92_07980 [Bradyrhizobium sp. AT1]|uniref:hypothetical protein n=1 Tax=Bradyrhizobium sp. AT1 TaxID=574934 RepID=UPI000799AB05|nr:hypothetical protein [Bradyrhizobium sp. AT1]KYG20208.1 hypothetical protein SE92_07980 [Bradyrhizobium sp. AT1]